MRYCSHVRLLAFLHSLLVGTYSYYIPTLFQISPRIDNLFFARICLFRCYLMWIYPGVFLYSYISLVDCIDHWRMLGLVSPSNPRWTSYTTLPYILTLLYIS